MSETQARYGLLKEATRAWPEYDVVIVHGICESSWTKEAWNPEYGDKKSAAFIRYIFESGTPDIFHFEYDISEEIPPVLRPGGIQAEAQKLLDGIVEMRINRDTYTNQHEEELRPVIFVSHDIGGIIVKECLILAARNPAKYGSIPYCVTNMIFLGCPHRASVNDLHYSLLQLFAYRGWYPTSDSMDIIPSLAVEVHKVNSEFTEVKLLIRSSIYNIYSRRSPDMEDEALFDLYPFPSSTCYFCVPYEVNFGAAVSHADLVVGDRSPMTYKALEGCVRSIKANLTSSPYFLYSSREATFSNKTLLALAPPIIPHDAQDFGHDYSEELSLILNSEPFKKWKYKRGHSILHIKGKDNLEMLSENVHEELAKRVSRDGRCKNCVYYFCFNRQDARFNNLNSMFTSLLSQILSKTEDASWIQDIMSAIVDHHHAFSDTDLIQLFELMNSGLSTSNYYATILIGCVDECDESLFPFLNVLKMLSEDSEQLLQIVFTSKKADDRLQKAISSTAQDFFEVDLEDFTPSKETFEFEIEQLCKKKPAYKGFQSELRSLLEKCSSSPDFGHILLDWLTFGSTVTDPDDIQDLLSSLSPISPKVFLDIVFASFGRHEKIARQLYGWVQSTFEPLAIPELTIALKLEAEEGKDSSVSEQEIYNYIQRFRWIFNLDAYEVSFSSFWRVTVEELATKEETHAKMAYLLLQYLSQTAVIEEEDKLAEQCMSLSKIPLSRPRQSLISYATLYWPRHYKAAGTLKPIAEATSFLQKKQSHAWEAFWFALANPITRSHQSYISMLPLAARLGLDDVVAKFVEGTAESHAMAIMEAVKNGHGDTARLLLSQRKPGNEYLHDILCAALSHGDEKILNELINLAAEQQFSDWPEVLFERATWLGLKSTVELAISKGLKIPIKPKTGNNVLSVAASSRHDEVLEVLLRQEEVKSILHVEGKDGFNPAHEAAFRGHSKSLELLLGKFEDVNEHNRELASCMQKAAKFGRHTALRLTLDKGADIESGVEALRGDNSPRDESKAKPILLACIHGNLKCVEVLLEKKANLEAKLAGRTPLWYAADGGYYDICRLLLEHGADPNNDPEDSRRILEAAINLKAEKEQCMKLVELFVEKGARVQDREVSIKNDTDLLSLAVKAGHEELVQYFLDHGLSPSASGLFAACSRGHREIVKKFLGQHVDVNKRVRQTRTPLHAACRYPDIVKDLLDAGADADIASTAGTALHIACENYYIDSLEVLLAHDPKPNLEIEINDVGDAKADEKTNIGMTALSMACWRGNVRAVRMLCNEGANINHQSAEKWPPLHFAIFDKTDMPEADHPGHVIETVLMYRPDLLLVDQDEDDVLHCIRAETPLDTIKALWRAGAQIQAVNKEGTTVLWRAAVVNNDEAFHFFLSKGADVNVCGPKKEPLLNYLARYGRWELFKAAIDAGADIHLCRRNHYKRTLLCEAFTAWDWSEGYRRIAEYLLDEAEDKADPNEPCEDQTLPYAIMFAANNRNAAGFEMLLKHGADVNVQDKMGRRPIHFAAFRSPVLLKMLLAMKDIEHMPRTVVGMTPFHFAASRAMTLSLSSTLYILLEMEEIGDINDADADGWTALMWACKHNYSGIDSIRTLLERGADIYATGNVLEGSGKTVKWSPLKISRYFGGKEDIQDLLTPKQKTRVLADGTKQAWRDRDHETKIAKVKGGWVCDYCLFELVGIGYKCVECEDFVLCYKCNRLREKLHPGHDFASHGPEFEEDSDSEDEEEKKADETNSDNATKDGSDEESGSRKSESDSGSDSGSDNNDEDDD